jgi:hypothetical protein
MSVTTVYRRGDGDMSEKLPCWCPMPDDTPPGMPDSADPGVALLLSRDRCRLCCLCSALDDRTERFALDERADRLKPKSDEFSKCADGSPDSACEAENWDGSKKDCGTVRKPAYSEMVSCSALQRGETAEQGGTQPESRDWCNVMDSTACSKSLSIERWPTVYSGTAPLPGTAFVDTGPRSFGSLSVCICRMTGERA